MAKMFTLNQLNQLFKQLYPDGEICKTKNKFKYDVYYNDNKVKTFAANNLYELAEKLNLVTNDTIAQMKKSAGYVSYQ